MTEQMLYNLVDLFNRAYKVGDKVIVMKDAHGTEFFTDTIKNKATLMGGHTAVTWLKEKGSYDLLFVRGLDFTHQDKQ